MVISPTDQEDVCCTFYIGTAFHQLFNNQHDYIRKDSVFMLRPTVEQFLLKGKKKKDSSSSKRTKSLMKKFDILLCCKLCGEEVYKLKEELDFQTCNRDLTKVFNEHYRKGMSNKCCKNLLNDESYSNEMNRARKKYMRKDANDTCHGIEKEMVVRYMTVLTQIFVAMKDILSFYNFLGKDGPRIAYLLSNQSPRRHFRKCTLKKREVQDEMLMNSITDFSSNKKSKYNTIAED
jgi:hypothetical protein